MREREDPRLDIKPEFRSVRNAKEALVVFICHGEKADNSNLQRERDRIDNEFDCPLTTLGLSQAHVTGQYLRKYFKENGFDKIIIESSPFLRTLETAAAIAKELSVYEIDVNYRAFEWFRNGLFNDKTIVHKLTFSMLERADEFVAFSTKYLDYPNLRLNHDRSFAKELERDFPESTVVHRHRINRMIDHLRVKY